MLLGQIQIKIKNCPPLTPKVQESVKEIVILFMSFSILLK